MKIRFEEIIITETFLQNPPKEEKLVASREYFAKHRRPNRVIEINDKNELVNGYSAYLVLKENNYNGEIEVYKETKRTKNVQYVYAIVDGNTEKYKVNPDWNRLAKPGDKIVVSTLYGLRETVVETVAFETPSKTKVRKVRKIL